jgi:type IV pilus assembly protein PilA
MIARIRKSLDEKEKGFTLIELLVVIIIIGILSAIAIPLFLNQRKKAEDAAAKADVSTIGKEIATWFVDSKTGPPTITASGTAYSLNGASIGNQSKNVVMTTIAAADSAAFTYDNWCVAVTNNEGDKSKANATSTPKGGFKYSAAGGLQQGVCP